MTALRTLSRDQVRRVDQLAMTRYAMPSLLLMENAGRSAADIIHRIFGPGGRAVAVCGGGNNGGDGCVIARHLHNLGWSARVLMTADEARFTPDTRANFEIARRMGLVETRPDGSPTVRTGECRFDSNEVILDALLGTGFSGEVREPLAAWICAINAAEVRAVVAIDVPSGLDCDTGMPSEPTVRADLTITFVALKTGFGAASAHPLLGTIHVADIGAPRELIEEIAAT